MEAESNSPKRSPRVVLPQARHSALNFTSNSLRKRNPGTPGDPDSARVRAADRRQARAVHARNRSAEVVTLIQQPSRATWKSARSAGKKYRIAVLRPRAHGTRSHCGRSARSRNSFPRRRTGKSERSSRNPGCSFSCPGAGQSRRPRCLARRSACAVVRSQSRRTSCHRRSGRCIRPDCPVPQLLRNRLDLLSAESRKAAQRVLAAFASVPHLRNKLPTASVGTMLQQLWLSLGGDRCVDATGRANLDLFWKLLDELPEGEQDLTGPALDAALEDLFALPDPASKQRLRRPTDDDSQIEGTRI